MKLALSALHLGTTHFAWLQHNAYQPTLFQRQTFNNISCNIFFGTAYIGAEACMWYSEYLKH